MKKIKITILETLGDNNEWRWYDIYRDSVATPEQAVKNYLEQEEGINSADCKLTEDEGYTYAEDYDVRAISYTI